MKMVFGNLSQISSDDKFLRVEFCIGNPPIDFVDLNNVTYRKDMVDYIVKVLYFNPYFL